MKRPVTHEQKSLWEATVAVEGITTGAGEGTGLSLIDAGLAGAGANSFVSMLAVINPGDPQLIDSRDVTAFNNGTGEVAVATVFKGGQVAAGVPYKIVTFRFVPAEVAALAADLTALMADVGDASGATLGSILGILGNPAQTFLAMIGYQGATSLANKLTAARAALLDQITAVRMGELDPGNLPGDIDTLKAYCDILDDAVNGLAAIKAEVEGLAGAAMRGTDSALLAAGYTAPDNAGIATLLTRITAAVALAADLATHETYQATHRTALGTHETAQATHRTALGTHDTDIKALLATITGYIDAEIAEIIASQGKMLFSMDFWSNPQEEVAVTGAQTTPGLPSVVVAAVPGTIVRAVAMFKFRMVENTNAAENSLDCEAVQPIQVDDSAPTGMMTAIDFVDEMYKIAAETREGGDVIIGDNDISDRVDGNDTYSFQWLNAKAHLANIQFNDVQVGLRIWYSV